MTASLQLALQVLEPQGSRGRDFFASAQDGLAGRANAGDALPDVGDQVPVLRRDGAVLVEVSQRAQGRDGLQRRDDLLGGFNECLQIPLSVHNKIAERYHAVPGACSWP